MPAAVEAASFRGLQAMEKRDDFAPELFSRFLWRARNWRGQKRIERESHDGMLETFQQQCGSPDPADPLDSLPSTPPQQPACSTPATKCWKTD